MGPHSQHYRDRRRQGQAASYISQASRLQPQVGWEVEQRKSQPCETWLAEITP